MTFHILTNLSFNKENQEDPKVNSLHKVDSSKHEFKGSTELNAARETQNQGWASTVSCYLLI